MNSIYHPMEHEYVMYNHDNSPEIGENGPYPIIHTTHLEGIQRIWISLPHHETPPTPHATQVTDGGSGVDMDGNRIWSVPAGCFVFLSEEEAEQIVAIRQIDEALLSYARG